MAFTYDEIGVGYRSKRRADARWAAQIEHAVRGAARIVNVGAGAGSYEPAWADVIAVEPSTEMITQRSVASAPVVRGVAEALPLPDRSCDAALATFTTHHWREPAAGFAEMRRVAARQVVVTWDPDVTMRTFWLVRDYLPAAIERESSLAKFAECHAHLDVVAVSPLLVPADMTDGVFGAYWKRPHAYLDATVRAAISAFALLDQAIVEPAVRMLADDLASGAWERRYAEEVLAYDEVDLGYRLVIAGDAGAT